MEEPQGTQSPWMKATRFPKHSALTRNRHTDVCVVGAGIAGLTTAYLLTSAGKSVVVLESGEIGRGETARTSAHLTSVLDESYDEIERLHGAGGARAAAESHTAAIDRIEAIVNQERIDCMFERVDGYIFLGPDDDVKSLDRQMEAAHKVGLHGAERLARAPLASFNTGPCVRIPRQAQFHPLRYLKGLAKAIERGGGRILTGTHVKEIEPKTKSGPNSQINVKTDSGKMVTALSVVVATNTPMNDFVTMHTKQAAHRTYVIGLRVPRGSVARGLYWDTADPYHYVRVQAGAGSRAADLLIVGGEDHKTGQAHDTQERFDRLLAWTRERFPKVRKPVFSWSGQVLYPMDGLAYIGRNPGDDPNIYIVTGDSGVGLTHGTIAGMLLTDLICGRPNPWTSLYDPSRITLRAAKEFARENLNAAAQYVDFLTPGEITDVRELAVDAGAIMRDGLSKIAVFRDAQSELHKRSAVCPHLGCIVDWNAAEKTWDCPCHGSRFDGPGKQVLNGPAIVGLTSP